MDPELVFIGSAPTLVASLIAREVPFASTAGTAVMSAVAGGAPLKILATVNNRSTYDFVARPGITRPEDLRGKRVGVQSIGGGIWMQALLALEHLSTRTCQGLLPHPGDLTLPHSRTLLKPGLSTPRLFPTVFSQPLKVRGYPVLLEMRNANIPLTNTSLFALKRNQRSSSSFSDC